ncbi:hypothetical protein M3Y99_01882300 [Aphelenchoides fujianensis]|nr:hypothetical protein M3Y99_01882300 [Aphelenchoides fujianensis]
MIVACLFLLLPLAHSFNLAKYPVPGTILEPEDDRNIYVSLDGDDTNAGTRDLPLRNLQTAIERADFGVWIVMRGGLYYNVSLGEIPKSVSIQAFPHEQVYLLGSVPLDDTGFKCRPEQVFVGGEPLTQVGAESKVKAGTFFVDNAAGRLVIGNDPTGRTVEAFIDGIGFAHHGSHLGQGAVIATGMHSSFYFCSFTFARAPNFSTCTGDSCLLAAADIDYATDGEAAVRIDLNTFHSNGANGLRLTADFPASVVRNLAKDNTLAGFVFKRANNSVFASNVAVGNAIGMHVISCPEAFVYNNDLVGNKQGLVVTVASPTKNSLLRVRNNLFSNNLERQLSVWAASKADLAKTFGIFDHNGYFQRNATGTRPYQWGNQTFVYHDGFVAASGFDKAPPSIDVRDQAAQPFFVNEGAGNFNLRANSVALKAGAALPTRIARELELKSSRVNMGEFLEHPTLQFFRSFAGAPKWPGQ